MSVIASTLPRRKFSYVRRLLAILLPGLLLLTACSGTPAAPEPTSQSAGDTAKFDSLKVTDNGDKKAPGVEFAKPLSVEELTINVVSEGSGDTIKSGQLVEMVFVVVDGSNGKIVEDGYASGPQQIEVNDELKSANSLLYNAIVGAKVGSHVALAAPGQAAAAAGAAAQPTQLLLIKLISAKDAPGLLSPEATAQLEKDGMLPSVTFDDKGTPAVEIPKTDAPDGLAVKVLSEGTGPVVAASDTISANYTGWRWNDGDKFDSTYDKGQPLEFELTNVIKGWTLGLAGQKVGSKVLLTIPSTLGYGDTPLQGRPGGPLVFVVEITAKK